MDPPRSVNLSELAGRVEVEPNYHVELPDAEFFILVAGGNYPAAATRYEHPNVAAKQDKVFLTRAYWPDGRKRWCQHAGRDFYFVIPRDRIALVFAKGYSYVPVIINGLTLHLNVSGGTIDGWTDFVRQQVSAGIQFSKQKLDLLAEAALPPEEVRGKASLELAELSAGDAAGFVELLAGQVCRSHLENGHELVLRDGYTYNGSRGPFFLESKATRRRYYIAKVGPEHLAGFRAAYTTIDWTATAAANEFAVPRPIQENRVGPVSKT